MKAPRGTAKSGSPAAERAEAANEVEAEAGFEAWLKSTTERLDPFMSWLGILFALLVGYGLAGAATPRAERTLEWLGWLIWAVFALDFAVKLYLAPRRVRFLRRHWLQVLMLAIPTLRVLRFARLLRIGRALPAARVVSSSYRAAGTARRLLRSRLAYLAGISSVGVIAIAELAFYFERQRPKPVFGSFGDAIMWSLGVVVGNQGDPVPHSRAAQLTMDFGFGFGLAIVASLAGAVGAFLVDDRRERAAAESAAETWRRDEGGRGGEAIETRTPMPPH
jgi:voltage-gated potassium channel